MANYSPQSFWGKILSNPFKVNRKIGCGKAADRDFATIILISNDEIR